MSNIWEDAASSEAYRHGRTLELLNQAVGGLQRIQSVCTTESKRVGRRSKLLQIEGICGVTLRRLAGPSGIIDDVSPIAPLPESVPPLRADDSTRDDGEAQTKQNG